jgi:hypothetical protein
MFLPCSEPVAELRHVVDLVFGVFCLERAGIDPKDIFIYLDSPEQNMDGAFLLASTHQYHSNPTSQFFTDLNDNGYDNLVMFVTGHGGPLGMDGPQPISPSKLLKALKNTPSLNNVIIYLGQCYAGTFNFVNAGRVNKNEPEVILVGATNLHESLSSGTSEKFRVIEFPWLANVFLLHVFKWISSPLDVDGDGLHTVMDSYKYAGMLSNMINKQMKTDGFVQIVDMHSELNDLRERTKVDTGDPQLNMENQLNCDAKLEMYLTRLAIHHVHQECWILNSRPAQQIEF